ncbi:MAG: hypothetical protein QOH79_3346 [Acidimicrobiaceae bacterium]
MAALEPWDPTPLLARWRFGKSPTAAGLLVYRHRNAALVAGIRASGPPDMVWRLWALDEIHPELETWTVGQGPGRRSPLLNKLYASLPATFDGHVVLSDDDYVFTRGELANLLAVAAGADLGLAQPAHDRLSQWSHWLTAGRRLSLLRLTTFVEIGPVVVVSPSWRHRVLPLADDGMGWGLDLRWQSLRQEGCRLGIVDSCLIRHLHPVEGNASYDVVALRDEMEEFYEARGGYLNALQTLATWRPWQRRLPQR